MKEQIISVAVTGSRGFALDHYTLVFSILHHLNRYKHKFYGTD